MRARARAHTHTSGTAAERVFTGVAAIIIAALCGVLAQGWKPAVRRKIHPWSWAPMGQGPGCACQGNPESESGLCQTWAPDGSQSRESQSGAEPTGAHKSQRNRGVIASPFVGEASGAP